MRWHMAIKKSLKDNFRLEFKHAFLYLILSTIWAIVDAVVFISLTNLLWLPIILSNVVSDTCGMITSFSLNVRKNFKHNDYIKIRFLSYVIISFTWMVLSTGMIYFFIEVLSFPKSVAKICQILIMAVPLYVANRLITFKKFK